MESEATYRRIQAVSLAYEAGGLWEDEYRSAVLDELDVVPLHKGISPAAQSRVAAITSPQPSAPANSNATPSNGNSGAVGQLSNGDNSMRDMDARPTA
jgi:hypothetical protein